MGYHILNHYILWNSKGEWLLTSTSNYMAEHIDMNRVERLGSNQNYALTAAFYKYGNDVTIMTENTPQV